jgi:hypothetical protein
MPVKVLFRGVSLFRPLGDRVEVLLPFTPQNAGGGRPRHYPRIVVWEAQHGSSHGAGKTVPARKWHRPLSRGVVVTFSPGEGMPACDFRKTARLNSVSGLTLRSPNGLGNPNFVAAKVILKGGSLGPTNWDRPHRPRNWTFPDHNTTYPDLAFELTWTADEDELKVAFNRGKPPEATLRHSETIMIGNRPDFYIDHWHPVHDHMHGHCTPGAPVSDRDFWWIYRLCTNVPAKAPVPEAICPGPIVPKGAGSPTCFMSWWE